jgi:DNA-binding response OmpR family regulator
LTPGPGLADFPSGWRLFSLVRVPPAGRVHTKEKEESNAMGKVMVVDDAYSELTMMEGILRNAGYKVVTLIDGDQLEEKVAEERPDVLLLDIVMPKRNGYEILRSIKRDGRTKDTPVVVVSSKNQESDRVWGKRQGADEYLGKPFTAEQLLEAVRRFAR